MSGLFSVPCCGFRRDAGDDGVRRIPCAHAAMLRSMARLAICLLGCAFAFTAPELRAQPTIAHEYEIKAVFLFNFAQFVEWPKSAFPHPDAPFHIGVLGADPFGAALKQTVAGESIRGRKVMLHQSHRLEDLRHCHLLFISASERGRVRDVLAQIGDSPVLTVSEIPNFAQHGGIVNFFLQGNKVRFEINVAAAQHHGLKLSSQLLSLAKIINQNPPGRLN